MENNEIKELINLDDAAFKQLMEVESFTISYKNSKIIMTVTDNKIYKVKVESKMKNGKISEYENFSSYKDKVLKLAFDFAKRHEISNKKNPINYIQNQFETLFMDIAKNLKATIFVCIAILVILGGFFACNMDLKYNQSYTNEEEKDDYKYVHEVRLNRKNVYHATSISVYPSMYNIDEPSTHKVGFYYTEGDKIVVDNKSALTFERKNPWVISYNSHDYVCVSGIIIDVMLLMALGADVFILAYAIKKNKKLFN